MATAYVESGWKQSAVSATGALGVGQLRPETAAWVAVVLLRQSGLDPNRPADNLRLSARFLRYLLDTMPDTRSALAAYYQGPGSVTREGITATGRAPTPPGSWRLDRRSRDGCHRIHRDGWRAQAPYHPGPRGAPRSVARGTTGWLTRTS